MIEPHRPVPLLFWRSAAGRKPASERLNEAPRDDQRTIARDIAKAQYGWPVCRPPGKGHWEVRSSLPSRREARVPSGFHDGMLIALTAFIKKTRAPPAVELASAQRRLKEATTS